MSSQGPTYGGRPAAIPTVVKSVAVTAASRAEASKRRGQSNGDCLRSLGPGPAFFGGQSTSACVAGCSRLVSCVMSSEFVVFMVWFLLGSNISSWVTWAARGPNHGKAHRVHHDLRFGRSRQAEWVDLVPGPNWSFWHFRHDRGSHSSHLLLKEIRMKVTESFPNVGCRMLDAGSRWFAGSSPVSSAARSSAPRPARG